MFVVETKIFMILYSLKSAIVSYCLLRLIDFCLSEMKNNGVTMAIAIPTRTGVPQAEKLGKFTGVNFKGWQHRVIFWLTTLDLQKFTSEETPVPANDMQHGEKIMIIEAWKQADFL